jgi:hypothetical protein
LGSLARGLWLRFLLNTALGRAAGLVLADPEFQRLGMAAAGPVVGVGTSYLEQMNPGTLKALGLSGDRLRALVMAEVGKRAATAPIGALLGESTLLQAPPLPTATEIAEEVLARIRATLPAIDGAAR